jgi:hypothetical protein
MRPNVRTSDTGIEHQYGHGRHERTHCGLWYLRDGQYRWANDFSPIASDTEAEVDCMACVAAP